MFSSLSLVPLPVLVVPSPPFPTVLPLLGSPVIIGFHLHHYTELPGGVESLSFLLPHNKAWHGLSYPLTPPSLLTPPPHLHPTPNPSPACYCIATTLPESAHGTANRTEQSPG